MASAADLKNQWFQIMNDIGRVKESRRNLTKKLTEQRETYNDRLSQLEEIAQKMCDDFGTINTNLESCISDIKSNQEKLISSDEEFQKRFLEIEKDAS
eukprot:TRINITY_DN6644_c1_g1_i1.p1 TRINITY_DN6644_c1_g1~~TRINITY_DN6644_c1_g1_i1.p1  ORF type:complete len:98 (+),score=31.03 TRINITY_DN6644_c1_g1_i1:60-353(+)